MDVMASHIYKIATREQLETAKEKGVFEGAPIDLQDGYIHFSTADQAEETIAKHFHGQKELFILTVRTQDCDEALKWEVSRGGALFPHLYAQLDMGLVRAVHPLTDLPDGGHQFPTNWNEAV